MRQAQIKSVKVAGFGPALVASGVGHLLLVGAGLFGLGWGAAQPVFPPGAIEVTLEVPALRQGARPRPPVGAAVPAKAEQASEVDLPVRKKKQPKPQQAKGAAPEPATPIGQGGQSVATAGRRATEWDRYRMRVRERIHEALLYPRASKSLGETGRVKVRFAVLRDGSIVDVGVLEPSAFDRLNLAAADTVRRVARVDPLPSQFSKERWDTFVPLDFDLR